MQLTNSEHALYTTTLITASGPGGISTGTGFYYAIILNHSTGDAVPMLVTNKHVLAGATHVRIHMHLSKIGDSRSPSGDVAEVDIEIGSGGLVFHPDQNIDLCALLIGPVVRQAQKDGRSIFFRYFVRANIPDRSQWENFDALEEVVMIGCPRGIYDPVNHNPIMRRGITATPLSRAYHGKPEFMVDMACFPGSSGSPVILMDHLGHIERGTKNFLVGARRFYLLGILYQGPLITNTGQIILSRPPSVQTATMMHLGNVIRSSELLVLEDAVKTQEGG